jgi:histone chaperone ASF1
MAEVAIMSVEVKNNPAPFLDDIELEVQYECLAALKDDLEWKVIYVGSAETEEYDQTLDTAFVGPVTDGSYRFTMKAPAPDAAKIPRADLVGVTALLLTCSYQVGGWLVGWGWLVCRLVGRLVVSAGWMECKLHVAPNPGC